MRVFEYDWSVPGPKALLSDLLTERLKSALGQLPSDLARADLTKEIERCVNSSRAAQFSWEEPLQTAAPDAKNVPCSGYRCGDPNGHTHTIQRVTVVIPVEGEIPLLRGRPGRGGGRDIYDVFTFDEPAGIAFTINLDVHAKSELESRVANLTQLLAETNEQIEQWNTSLEQKVETHILARIKRDESRASKRASLGLPPLPEAAQDAVVRETTPSSPTKNQVVFVSYVRDNSAQVDLLVEELKSRGYTIWLDRKNLGLGTRWKGEIKKAISDGVGFIACFSSEYNDRTKSYMNEELTLAVDEIRARPTSTAWFFPIRLNECDIPDRSIGGGETLRDLNSIDLFDNDPAAIDRIAAAIDANL